MINERQHEVIQWAKALVNQQPLILDTETTGLKESAEICQIAIVNLQGDVLLDTLVKPRLPIPPDATRIHGITNEMVQDENNWGYVGVQVMAVIAHRPVIVYNAAYDLRIMEQSGVIIDGETLIDWKKLADFHCAMERYAEYFGDWNEHRRNYRWIKLTDACRFQGIPEIEAPAHSALGDCLRTLALVKHLASKEG